MGQCTVEHGMKSANGILVADADLEDSITSCLDRVVPCLDSHEKILTCIKRILSDEGAYGALEQAFYGDPEILASKSERGVVETPQKIAEYMVALAFDRWRQSSSRDRKNDSVAHWFDPCGGAGVFPVEIIRHSVQVLGIKEQDRLPRITISEISPLGLAVSLLNVVRKLRQLGLSASEYLRSGKLELVLGDTLEEFTEDSDLFHVKKQFDIVIGNPPYVRASRLTARQKLKLKQNFPATYHGNCDLYTYFIAGAVSHLRSGGVLAYISPVAFMRAKSYARLRDWLLERISVDSFIDLDETQAFPDADLHPGIYLFRKSEPFRSNVEHLLVQNDRELDDLLRGNSSPCRAVVDACKGHGWSFHASQGSFDRYSRLFSKSVRLQDLGLNVYSGIRTGYARAYVIDHKQYESFSVSVRTRWIKPIVLPAHINRWVGFKQLNYLIVIPAGTDVIDPELYEYLYPHKEALSRRPEVKGEGQWFALRPCGYYSEMHKRKIAFPDIATHSRFGLVDEGIYIPDGAYFIDSDSPVLLGLLNSDVAREYFVHRCSSVGSLSSKGRFRFKKAFINDFPLPARCLMDGVKQRRLAQLVDRIFQMGETHSLMNELNAVVLSMYQGCYD